MCSVLFELGPDQKLEETQKRTSQIIILKILVYLTFQEALCTYIIMTIIQGIQQRPLHHDYKQTKTLPVITIGGFQTSVTDVRC